MCGVQRAPTCLTALLPLAALAAKLTNEEGMAGSASGLVRAAVGAGGDVEQAREEASSLRPSAGAHDRALRAREPRRRLVRSEANTMAPAGLAQLSRKVGAATASRSKADVAALGGLTSDCVWGNWADWSACSAPCGGGVMERRRDTKFSASDGGKECEGPDWQEEACNLAPCPRDCKWGDWGRWESCSKSCGGGETMRSRTVAELPFGGGRRCEGLDTEKQPCEEVPCPVDCSWGDWGRWSECSKTCGGGNVTRTRGASVPSAHGGKACEGGGDQTVACNTDACPTDCRWGDWATWSACSASCGSGSRNRRREKEVEAQAGGEDCNGNMTEQESCVEQPCAVDCEWSPWSDWPACSKSCGGGQMARNRSVTVQAASGGKQCEGSPQEEVSCGVVGCPVNCEWTEWGAWADCTRTCGGGRSSRSRLRALEAANGGQDCPGGAVEQRACGTEGCPVDCEWGDWSAWSGCSRSCGGGVLKRRRQTTVAAAFGGSPCQGQPEVTEPCNTQGCPVDCVWSDWGRWTACTATCGNGTAARERQTLVQGRFGGRPCEGSARQTELCNSVACPVHCSWSEWGNWSQCSQSCGAGLRTRSREELVPAKNGGAACPGHGTEQGDCNTQACPVDCQWEPWSDWEACSVTCGNGVHARVRTKQTEANGGRPCNGTDNEKAACGQANCTATAATEAASSTATPVAAAGLGTAANGSGNDSTAPAGGNATVAAGNATMAAGNGKMAVAAKGMPAAAVAAGTPKGKYVVGDIVLSIPRPAAAAANPELMSALAEAVAALAGVRREAVHVVSSAATAPAEAAAMLAALARGARAARGAAARAAAAGIVAVRYTIDISVVPASLNATARNVTGTIMAKNLTAVTFAIADALKQHHVDYTVEALSISADEADTPTVEASASRQTVGASASSSSAADSSPEEGETPPSLPKEEEGSVGNSTSGRGWLWVLVPVGLLSIGVAIWQCIRWRRGSDAGQEASS